MISRSATCFSLALVSLTMVALSSRAGSASSFTGHVELRDSREKSVERGHDYSGVVVWLEPVNGRAPAPATLPHVTMLQKNKRFIPHILAIRRGTVVDFRNQDPIFHNAFSSF